MYIKCKPGIRGTEQEFEVFEFAEVIAEICQAGFGDLDALYVGIFIEFLLPSRHDVFDISWSLIDVTLNIHGETRSFRNGEAEVECNSCWYASKTDQETPDSIDTMKLSNGRGREDGVFVGSGNNEWN